MNPCTLSRGACSSSSSSSSLVRAFSTSSSRHLLKREKRQFLRKGAKRSETSAPPAILRSLVNLHHASATFLHDAKEASTGFDNAFRYTVGDPYFMSYPKWKSSVMAHGRGESNLIDHAQTLLGSESDKRSNIIPAPTYGKTFKKRTTRSWSGGGSDSHEVQSDREVAVREALFGTWERGGLGMKGAEPGLDGVKEWLDARGVTVQQFAREWEYRHDDSPDLGNVITGGEEVLGIEGGQAEATSSEGPAGGEFGEVGAPKQ